MKILNLGSINIDHVYSVEHIVRRGETISSKDLQIFSGGKGFNQSLAISRAGQNVYHAGLIGEDGSFLIEILEKSGVNTQFIKKINTVGTGNAIIQKDKDGNNCIILYPGANREFTKEYIDLVLDKFKAGDYIILQNEINEISYIVDQAKSKGMTIVLNPSPMDNKILEIDLHKIDYFILNEVEAYGLINVDMSEKLSSEQLLERLVSQFPNSKIVLTLGEKGSIYADRKEKKYQDIYEVDTIDTTAAGDTFTGYFVAGLVSEIDIEKTMDMAARASALAVTKLGAEPSIPNFDEVKKYNFKI